MTRTRRWTSPADLEAKVRRRWDDGSLLTALARQAPFPVLDLPLSGPRPGEIGEDVAAVRQWIGSLEAGSHRGRRYDIDYAEIGGRSYGRNRIPARAQVRSYDQAWRLLGTTAEASAYGQLLELAAPVGPVHSWAVHRPLAALAVAEDWPALLAAYTWLDGARGSGRYLREITAPGVDTKFVERHRPVLAHLLAVPRTGIGFTSGLGLRTRPETVRLRFGDGFMGMPGALTDGVFRVDELARVRVEVESALIVENETTFLSVDIPPEGVVVWGKGFEVDRAGSLPWLRGSKVAYWGDLDTHGSAILDRLRAWLPQTRSVLMDRETLIAHRDRWVSEPSPTSARLRHLTPAEADLYDDLVCDRLGEAVRLEQERIAWDWALDRLS